MSQARMRANDIVQSVVNIKLIHQLRVEFENKPIIKYGAWFIFAIIILYAGLVVSDEVTVLRKDLDNVESQLSKVRQIQSELFWNDRLTIEKNNASKIEGAILQASSTSIAKAQAQTSITALARKYNIQQSRVSATEPVFYGRYNARNVYTVNVELRGRLKRGSALNIINELALSPLLQEVERLDIEFEQNRRLHVIIKTYFFIES